MKKIKPDKKVKLGLNKRTITHLDTGQMAWVSGGNASPSVVVCDTCPNEQGLHSSQECPTYDTGIPPSGKRHRFN